MDNQTKKKLLELNDKWKTASSEEERKTIAEEVSKLIEPINVSEKIEEMEIAIANFKAKLETAKDGFQAKSIEVYNKEIAQIQNELEKYKQELLLILKS